MTCPMTMSRLMDVIDVDFEYRPVDCAAYCQTRTPEPKGQSVFELRTAHGPFFSSRSYNETYAAKIAGLLKFACR